METVLIENTENNVVEVTSDACYVLLADESLEGNYYLELNFAKKGVNAEILGFFNLTGDSKASITTVTRHIAPNTSCRTEVKGVLNASSQSDYVGKIIIEKGAQQTSSFLHDSVLILGDNTKNTSKPILEIEADDVRASHGATTGRIDKSQIYYLESRGLSKEQAEKTIVRGYFMSLVSKISDENIKEKVVNKLKLANEE